MKRILSLLLVIVMVCMMPGTGLYVRAEESKGVTGVWKLEKMDGDDNVISEKDVQDYEAMNVAMYMKFRDNGTVKFSTFGDEIEGTWNEFGITLDGSWLNYTQDGDILTVGNADGGEMVFRRSNMEEINGILGYKDVLDKNVSYSGEDKRIMDTEFASGSITSYQADQTGFTINLRFKNKKKNNIVISADNVVLNKYIFHPEWAVSLEKKETVKTEMKISPEELEMSGITRVDEVILGLRITESDTEKVLQKGIVSKVYPTGKKAEEIKAADRAPVDGEMAVIADKEKVYVIQGTNPDDPSGFAINAYLENNSGRPLTFTMAGVTVNDQPINIAYEENVLPGTRGYSDAVIFLTDLQDLGLDTASVTSVKGVVRVYDKTKDSPELVVEKEFTYGSLQPIE